MLSIVFLAFLKLGISQISIGIDFGGTYLKVAYVSVGKPIETVLDRDSRRKTLAIVGVKNGNIVFTDAAKSHDRRNPASVIKNIDRLLGRRFDDPSIVKYRQANPHLKLVKDEQKENITFTPVELFALLLDEVHQYSSSFTNYNVSEFSIAFPPIFDQSRANAVLSASRISKMNLLEILDTSTTISTNYVISRKQFLSTTPGLVMFVDIGSTNTIVTISRVGLDPGSKVNTTVGSYNITGSSYVDVGAEDLDYALSDSLISEFKVKNKISDDIASIHKTRVQFVDQARSVKHCLTSSKECFASIEEVYNDISFRTAITRDLFKEIGAKILDKIADAIDRALVSANISTTDLSEVVIMGGGSLIPSVQEIITQKTGHIPSKVLNTDESNAGGASFHSARAHGLFKVAEFKVPSFVYYPIEIDYNVTVIGPDGNKSMKHHREILYPEHAKFTAKKVLTITNVSEDFTIRVRYAPPGHMFSDLDQLDIMDIDIQGISELVSTTKDIPRHLAIHFRFDSFRILGVHKVSYLLESNKTESIVGQIGKAVMDLFGKGGSKSNDTDTPDADEEVVASSPVEKNVTSETASQSEPSNETKKPKNDNYTVDVRFETRILYLKPPTEEELRVSKEKIHSIHEKERLRKELTKARSDLESGIFENQQAINDQELKVYLTDEEHKVLIETTERISNEFEQEGSTYDTKTLENKLIELKSSVAMAGVRKQEAQNVNRQVENLRLMINNTMTLVGDVFQKSEFAKMVNETLLFDTLNKSISTREWLDKQVKKQEELKPSEKRHLTSAKITKKAKELEESTSQLYQRIRQTNELLEKIQKQLKSGQGISQDTLGELAGSQKAQDTPISEEKVAEDKTPETQSVDDKQAEETTLEDQKAREKIVDDIKYEL
ncbi:Hypoxia up-regulated protein 1 [Thelohanellus kitauei]|uniref:Hypoxia up-regulated protein 1 n=1 Tax=Thelohanellus kitauei TaxID=669202 RepID=A0A0C2MMD0_THEKT|nr:Hypoxia up-regulated protein 1 [Thelohanellus kitauei]